MANQSTISFGGHNYGFEVGQSHGPITAEFHLPPERPQTPPTPSSTVPFRRDREFINRKHLIGQIRQACAEPSSRVALLGLGGVGKSQLAIEYSYQIKETEESKDTWIFWVHASSKTRIEEGFKSIADAVNLPYRNQPRADILELVYQWLSNLRNGRWLMILDSADDSSIFYNAQKCESLVGGGKALWTYLPQSPNGSILITTRNRELAIRLTGHIRCIIEVGPMDSPDALALLKAKCADQSDMDGGAELVQTLDYIPLAISQAGAYIQRRSPRISVRKYLEGLQKSERKKSSFLKYDAGDIRRDGSASNSILATWQISFEYIHLQRPSATDLLSLMSFFDHQDIPEFLVRPETKEVHGDEAGSISSCDSLNDAFDEDIQELRNFCLISISNTGDTFEMHRLVQLAIRKWLELHKKIEEFKRQYISRMAQAFPTGLYNNWKLCQRLFVHVEGSLNNRPVDDDSLKEWALLLNNGGWYAWTQGKYSAAEKMLRTAKALRQNAMGVEDVSALETTSLLGLTLGDYGFYDEAESLFLQLLETTKKVLGEEHPDTLTTMGNLADTYCHQGRLKESEALGKQVIELSKKFIGAEDPRTLTAMSNLALTYRGQGRWQEAASLGLQVMELSKKLHGADHPDTLAVMANLALTYNDQCRWKEAESLCVQVLEMREKVLGPEHPETLMSKGNLASTYLDQGRWEEAEILNIGVAEMRKRVLGDEHPQYLNSMAAIALTYLYQGRWIEAQALLLQTLGTREKVLGVEHPDTLATLSNLAVTYSSQSRWEEAESLEVLVIESRKKVLGEKHPDTITGMANLQSTYVDQSRWEDAESLGLQVLKLGKEVLGADHPDTLTSFANLATIYWHQGRWDEAESLEMQVLETRKKVQGVEHPDTLTSMANLAFTWKSQGRLDAIDLMRDSVRARIHVLGPEDPDTMSSLSTLNEWRSE